MIELIKRLFKFKEVHVEAEIPRTCHRIKVLAEKEHCGQIVDIVIGEKND